MTANDLLRKLQKEQPDGLDEAAKEYARNYIPFDQCDIRDILRVFKAGAKWMAGQGVTVKGLQYGGNLGIPDIPEEFYTDKQEKVIVQIRKK